MDMTLPPIRPHDHPDHHAMVWTEMEIGWIKCYAAAAVAAEREACAKLCESWGQPESQVTCDNLAQIIRARSAV